jgi:hypothetical protein
MARIALALALLVSTGCSRDKPPPTPTPTPIPYPATWRFHTEEEWLVAQTVEAVAGLALYASGRSGPASIVSSVSRAPLTDLLAPRRFAVRLVPGVFAVSEIELRIADHIWSPSAYADVARKLLPAPAQASETPPRQPPARADLAAALLDLRVAVLERENRRISKALSLEPSSPTLHEQAALLLGVFALRETGWYFYDPRVPLCRIAAHLAVARASADAPITNDGRLAETALDVLAYRQKAAVERLGAFEPASRAERAWVGLLRMGATGDWRALPNPERASLLERFVYARALVERLDINQAADFVDRARREGVTDWRRLMLYGGVNVEACNTYRGWGVLADEAEMLEVWREHRGAALDPEVWLEAIQMDPAPSPVISEDAGRSIEVLDLGLWMAFERRQVLNQLRMDDVCTRSLLGLDEQGRGQRKQTARDYGRLAVYPLLAREHTADPTTHAATMKQAAELVKRRPDLVTAAEWIGLSQPTPQGPPATDLPPYNIWFDPYAPIGTAFDPHNRAGNDSFRPFRVADFKSVRLAQAALAPYSHRLRWRVAQSRGGKMGNPGFDVIEPLYREFADYDAWALKDLVWYAGKFKKDDAYRRYATRLCGVLPDNCSGLADWLARRGEREEAAKAYRLWAAKARDRVGVANGISWLVNYEYDRGNKAEAFRLAREAAAVYSAGGLETLARLLEQSGDLTGAEREFRKMFERYETAGQYLVGFYSRHAHEPRLRPGMRRLEKEIFPDGLARMETSALKDPPTDGVLIAGSSPAAAAAGLKQGHVVVALDGYRVRTLPQYHWIRFLSPLTAPMALSVWETNRYLEIRAQPEDRWFGVPLENYRPERP